MKMDIASNNLQRLCHKNPTNQPTNQPRIPFLGGMSATYPRPCWQFDGSKCHRDIENIIKDLIVYNLVVLDEISMSNIMRLIFKIPTNV